MLKKILSALVLAFYTMMQIYKDVYFIIMIIDKFLLLCYLIRLDEEEGRKTEVSKRLFTGCPGLNLLRSSKRWFRI